MVFDSLAFMLEFLVLIAAGIVEEFPSGYLIDCETLELFLITLGLIERWRSLRIASSWSCHD